MERVYALHSVKDREATAMPTKTTRRRAQQAKREGKAPTTQAGEFVREEMHRTKKGTRGVKSKKQAVAIGLSKARRAGVKVPDRTRSWNSSSRRTKR
jgi:hypothetical protein